MGRGVGAHGKAEKGVRGARGAWDSQQWTQTYPKSNKTSGWGLGYKRTAQGRLAKADPHSGVDQLKACKW